MYRLKNAVRDNLEFINNLGLPLFISTDADYYMLTEKERALYQKVSVNDTMMCEPPKLKGMNATYKLPNGKVVAFENIDYIGEITGSYTSGFSIFLKSGRELYLSDDRNGFMDVAKAHDELNEQWNEWLSKKV